MKPFRGKRRGPQSPPVGFSPPQACRARSRIRKGRCAHGRVGEGCTSGGRSATTGSPAVISPRGRWPFLRVRCYRPGRRWPVGGPRKTALGRHRASRVVRVVELRGLFSVPANRIRASSAVSESARGRWRIGRSPVRPVLKHGPRSLTCARVAGLYETRRRNESEGRPRGRPR